MKKTSDIIVEYIRNNYHLHTDKKELAEHLNIKYNTLIDIAFNIGVSRKNINKKGDENITCTNCKNVYPKSKEYFTSCNTKRNGITFITKCKICEKEYVQKRNSTLKCSLRSIFKAIDRDDKRKSRGFDINLEYLHYLWEFQNGLCAVSGEPMTYVKGKGVYYFSNVSLDRIDSENGYVRGNLQLVCSWINSAKGTMKIDEFFSLIIKTYHNIIQK